MSEDYDRTFSGIKRTALLTLDISNNAQYSPELPPKSRKLYEIIKPNSLTQIQHGPDGTE